VDINTVTYISNIIYIVLEESVEYPTAVLATRFGHSHKHPTGQSDQSHASLFRPITGQFIPANHRPAYSSQSQASLFRPITDNTHQARSSVPATVRFVLSTTLYHQATEIKAILVGIR